MRKRSSYRSIKNYLTNRKQYIDIEEDQSEMLNSSLFIIYINDCQI